jgi:thiamine transporter ThiT
MADSATEYHHGDQSDADQAATYRLFGTLTRWVSLCLAVLILMLTLWFCVGVGFLGGLIPGLIVLAAGSFFLRPSPDEEH